MKNLMAFGFAAAVALSTSSMSLPAHADNEDTAMKNEKRAVGQEYKADRAAARGNGYKAEKHIDNANRDFYKVNKDEHRAVRDELRSY